MNHFKRHPITLKINDFNSESMKRWNTKGFFINSGNIRDTFSISPARSDYYSIGVCTSGYARILINGEELQYDKNSFALLLPNTVSEVLEFSNDYSAMSIYFEKEFLLSDASLCRLDRYQLFNYRGIPYLKIANTEISLIIDYIEKLRLKMEDIGHLFRESIIRNQIINLINELEHMYLSKYVSYCRPVCNNGKQRLITEFKELLRKNFKKQHHTTFYADALHITSKYLNELIKENTGKTTKSLINEALLTEAKILLKSGVYNVSEVCAILEYDNLEVFSRFFKKNTGQSPLQFRKG